MGNKRMLALLLAGTLILSLLGAAAMAADPAGISEPDTSQPPAASDPAASNHAPPSPDASASGEDSETPAPVQPDKMGTIAFSSLETQMREHNFNFQALEETIASIESIDYEEMTEDMRKQLNNIASMQWAVYNSSGQIQTGMPALDSALQGIMSMSASSTSASLEQSYKALRSTFDDLKDGVMQEDNAAIVRQLRNAQDQIIMAGETLYIALVSMEQNDVTLTRSLNALDRTIQELELRYDLGQIASLTLQQTKGSRNSLVSGQMTLESNLTTYKTQLEMLLGAEQTGTLQIQPLPAVTSRQLAAMDLEADLEAAQKASYELFSAQRTLEDAREEFEDAGDQYHHNERKYQYVAAQHTWQSAQHTYNATVQSFELKFRTLYAKVKDCQQVLQASRTALAVEEANCAADQLKYEQGTISRNALLTAQDDLAAARDKVDSAAVELFSAYHNYRWAVDHGILN